MANALEFLNPPESGCGGNLIMGITKQNVPQRKWSALGAFWSTPHQNRKWEAGWLERLHSSYLICFLMQLREELVE